MTKSKGAVTLIKGVWINKGLGLKRIYDQKKTYRNTEIVTNHIKMKDYDLSIGAFCVKLRSRIWFQGRLGQAADGSGVEGGGQPVPRSPGGSNR